jgi:flagellar basal-body rod protein FlgG
LQVGLGVRPVSLSRNFSQGNLQQTGNTLDIAVKGNGFFQIQMPDGSVAYTRDGAFQVDAQGQLVTNNGFTVQPGITIPANAQSVTIAADGTGGRAAAAQSAPTSVGSCSSRRSPIRRPRAARPEPVHRDRRLGHADTRRPGSDGLGTLAQGYVETSNVNVVEELVAMIQTQRAYEINSKAIQTSDQMLQRLGQL